jgi:hypothetical protein
MTNTTNPVDEFIASIDALPRDKLVKLYVKTREAKAAAAREAKAKELYFDAIMDKAEAVMLDSCLKSGETGFTTPFGTTYIQQTVKVSLADDEAFFNFVRETGDLDMFERRVASKHVQDYMTLNGGVAPPGLSLFRENVLRVRKASGEK